MWSRAFLDHPRSVGEGYWDHQHVAFGFAFSLMAAGVVCLIHGLVPCLFETTASRAVTRLHVRMVTHRRRARAVVDDVSVLIRADFAYDI